MMRESKGKSLMSFLGRKRSMAGRIIACATLCGIGALAGCAELPEPRDGYRLTYKPHAEKVSYLFEVRCKPGWPGGDGMVTGWRSIFTYDCRERGEWLEVKEVEILLDDEGKSRLASEMAFPISRTGRMVDERGDSGYTGEMGRGKNPLILQSFEVGRGFPWLPDHPVVEGDTWEERVKVGKLILSDVWSKIFRLTIRWTVKGVEEFQGRRCLRIVFEHEGTVKLPKGARIVVKGNGSWLFDMEAGIDVLVEQTVTHSSFERSERRRGTTIEHVVEEYRTKKVLCEKVLLPEDFPKASDRPAKTTEP